MNEQRLFPRTDFDALIRCSGNKKAMAKDVSLDGLCFRSYDKYSAGTPIDIHFTLDDKNKVEIRGRIVWSRKVNSKVYESGMKFLTINSLGRNNLSKYINTRLKEKESKKNSPQFLIDVLINYSTAAKARTRNISKKGINLFTEKVLSVGDLMTVSIPLPAGDEIKAHVKVLWTREIKGNLYENGMEFWNIENDDVSKLMQFALPVMG